MIQPPEVIVGLQADGERLTTAITLVAPLRFTLPPREPLWLLERHFVVPAGYVSDGASVPRLFWRLLSPPIDPVTLAPSIIHDWLYDNAWKYDLTRLECDRWYRDALIANGYQKWKANLTYFGIRLRGGRHWRRGPGWRNVTPPPMLKAPGRSIDLKKHGDTNGRHE